MRCTECLRTSLRLNGQSCFTTRCFTTRLKDNRRSSVLFSVCLSIYSGICMGECFLAASRGSWLWKSLTLKLTHLHSPHLREWSSLARWISWECVSAVVSSWLKQRGHINARLSWLGWEARQWPYFPGQLFSIETEGPWTLDSFSNNMQLYHSTE